MSVDFSSGRSYFPPCISYQQISADPACTPCRPIESDIQYTSRRMSSSGTSAADTDSSAMSRGEKRPLTPSDSPRAKKPRPAISVDQTNVWDAEPHSAPATANEDKTGSDGKVQLPSIFTTFEESYRNEGRRASLPTLHSESRVRHHPYPPTSLRSSYTASNQSNLSSYQFPPPSESLQEDKNSGRPRLSADPEFGLNGQFADHTYPNSVSNGTTPSSSTFTSNFSTPPSSAAEYRTQNIPPYADGESWNTSPEIVRPNSTPGQLSTSAIKYDDSLRHASFSTPMPQSQMYAGSARISGQQDRRSYSTAGIKSEWSFPSPEFLLPSNAPSFPSSSPPMAAAAPVASTNSPSRSPPSVPSSTLVDRPQRKRGKLPKETTDFLKAWLHRHSDHPYPSEEEKKQLCHATGLSMSQVSNWMINV